MMVFTSAPFNPYDTSTDDKAKTNGMVIICSKLVFIFRRREPYRVRINNYNDFLLVD